VLSLVILTAGLLMYARLPVDATYAVDIAPAMVLTGLGAGLGFPALTADGDVHRDPGRLGRRVGPSTTPPCQVGGAIGLAVLSSLANDRTHHLAATGPGQRGRH